MTVYNFTDSIHPLLLQRAYNERCKCIAHSLVERLYMAAGEKRKADINTQIQDSEHSSRRLARSLKAEFDSRRSFLERIADKLTSLVGSMPFLLLNVAWFSIWIAINVGAVPGIEPFDPFPFGFLTMVVSLEAIVLAIVVLVSQNRASKVDDLRQEVMLQLNVLTEEEMTKMMNMLCLLLEKQGIDLSDDPELESMLAPTNVEKIERSLEEEIGSASQQK
jgi:uncharacterized membrane protein